MNFALFRHGKTSPQDIVDLFFALSLLFGFALRGIFWFVRHLKSARLKGAFIKEQIKIGR